MERLLRRWAVAGLGTLALLGLSGPQGAWAAVSQEAPVVEPSVESWYQVSPTGGPGDPTCGLPLGCLPALPLTLPGLPAFYGPGTLHVGMALGIDTSWTFLSFDTTKVSGPIAGGVLRLPVLPDAAEGSYSLGSVELVACALDSPARPARGATSVDAPVFDCGISSPGRLNDSVEPAVYEFDLRDLVGAITTNGVAIVPTTSARLDRASFGVAFPAADHPSGLRIGVELIRGEPPPAPSPSGDSPTTPPPPPAPDTQFPSVDFGSELAFPPMSDVSPPQVAAPAPTEGVRPAPIVSSPRLPIPGYAYPMVWLAPFAIAGVAVMTSRALTKPLVLDRHLPG